MFEFFGSLCSLYLAAVSHVSHSRFRAKSITNFLRGSQIPDPPSTDSAMDMRQATRKPHLLLQLRPALILYYTLTRPLIFSLIAMLAQVGLTTELISVVSTEDRPTRSVDSFRILSPKIRAQVQAQVQATLSRR